MIVRDAQALPFRFRVFQVRFGPRPCRCLAAASRLPRGTAPWERADAFITVLGGKAICGDCTRQACREDRVPDREGGTCTNPEQMCQGWHGVGRSEALTLHS